VTVWGIVVAAGSGSRFGGPKHEVVLSGRPLWSWAQAALRSGGVDDVVLVGDVPGGIRGGSRRRDSVAAGLEKVPDDVAYTLVHDAARPLASKELVHHVIDRLVEGDIDAVIPAVPVRDTLKRVAGARVIATVDRSSLVAVQTPQGFRTEALRAAHQGSSDDVTDDAALIEQEGGSVVTIVGDPRNIKVTYPEDLIVAEALVSAAIAGERP
jgi:2-C-methyl-D-erythritol 4-phosphate cytidylyltransferase